ncbi:RHS repeat-associated core domain-containing protein, partial [Arsukibacterium sp.]|uniref:RHS repeat-associated core domain-containing protein n=1 Tax=Arsukibacterium sp. TaxID=1977258 RepID=UPI002FDB8206
MTPLIGRFYSNDMVGFTPSNPMMFNRYSYANNNPFKFVDPTGTCPEDNSFRDCIEIGVVKEGGEVKGSEYTDNIAKENHQSHRVLSGTVEKASVIKADGSLICTSNSGHFTKH